jgi:hypothetical protein
MVRETGQATERFLRSVAYGEGDRRASIQLERDQQVRVRH